VDERLRRALEAEAASRRTSLNRTVLALLRRATGLETDRDPIPVEVDDLADLAGTWTADEADALDRILAEQRPIEEHLWPPTR